ncbi:MAG: aldo/keto reductase [Deltaproteobacteria bacterium]|nr:MAG: aldo/keto reductase [Deltaproteobacteria bacterium]
MAVSGRSVRGLTRRSVLSSAGALAAGWALEGCGYQSQLFLVGSAPTAETPQEAWSGSRVARYRPLGRTGFEMSDISFGCAGLSDPAVVRRAIERGINYFDTSPDYSHAQSERALGEGIRGVPRDALFVASKLCTPDGHLRNETPVARVIEAVESSLRRIGTDHLDLVHVHAVNSIDRLMAPSLHEAFDRLREAGKVRFLGVSSHTPNLEAVMHHAVDVGRFDVIMVAYNFENWPDLSNVFRKAHERGVGVVAMKTLKGAHHTHLADFEPTERTSFAQAAFSWVLENPDVSGLVVSIRELAQIDEYLYASGKRLSDENAALLGRYDRLVTRSYCRPGCGECLERCPHGVPIDDVLRYRMYAENYGRTDEAMRLYARVDPARRADRCASCDAPCAPACRFGLPIRERLVQTERLLRPA